MSAAGVASGVVCGRVRGAGREHRRTPLLHAEPLGISRLGTHGRVKLVLLYLHPEALGGGSSGMSCAAGEDSWDTRSVQSGRSGRSGRGTAAR